MPVVSLLLLQRANLDSNGSSSQNVLNRNKHSLNINPSLFMHEHVNGLCVVWSALTLTTMVSSDFGRMLSVGAIRFEDRFCASKKGRTGGGGRVSARGAVHMAAALAGCRKALVGNGWTISHLVSTNRLRNNSPPLVGAPFLDL